MTSLFLSQTLQIIASLAFVSQLILKFWKPENVIMVVKRLYHYPGRNMVELWNR